MHLGAMGRCAASYLRSWPGGWFETEKLKNAAAFALRKCREMGMKRPGIPISAFEGFAAKHLPWPVENRPAERTLTGAMAGLHRFNEMKTKNFGCPGQAPSPYCSFVKPSGPPLSQIVDSGPVEVAGICWQET